MLATVTTPERPVGPDLIGPDTVAVDGLDDFDAFRVLELAGFQLPCWAGDPDLFFAESPTDVERAKALCISCPAREACLSGALRRREPYGVWGGELVVQGAVVARKRPRGRPRKHPLPEPAVA